MFIIVILTDIITFFIALGCDYHWYIYGCFKIVIEEQTTRL